ncbi:hypothetical protein GJ496_002973 [Pomphorhynchus laevis]|nr:hypothetical protein GJ496_002973 [Pomphorhynchus laevis]
MTKIRMKTILLGILLFEIIICTPIIDDDNKACIIIKCLHSDSEEQISDSAGVGVEDYLNVAKCKSATRDQNEHNGGNEENSELVRNELALESMKSRKLDIKVGDGKDGNMQLGRISEAMLNRAQQKGYYDQSPTIAFKNRVGGQKEPCKHREVIKESDRNSFWIGRGPVNDQNGYGDFEGVSRYTSFSDPSPSNIKSGHDINNAIGTYNNLGTQYVPSDQPNNFQDISIKGISSESVSFSGPLICFPAFESFSPNEYGQFEGGLHKGYPRGEVVPYTSVEPTYQSNNIGLNSYNGYNVGTLGDTISCPSQGCKHNSISNSVSSQVCSFANNESPNKIHLLDDTSILMKDSHVVNHDDGMTAGGLCGIGESDELATNQHRSYNINTGSSKLIDNSLTGNNLLSQTGVSYAGSNGVNYAESNVIPHYKLRGRDR